MKATVKALVSAACLSATAILPVQAPAAGIDVDRLTLEEKAALITGRNKWETHPVPRLGVPAVWMADGPVGLRKNIGDAITDSLPATCFPSAAAMAATWNPGLIQEVGAGIGAEARFHDVALLLAPGLNLKRHPLGGRNFEYYSEDPLLSGRIAAAFVRGVQSQGVGATVKHFAVNNQEHRRMTIDARVAERPLRELYLRGFKIAVEEGRPQAVMAAYNRVNGTYASQNRRLLTEILRQEWGFEGLVVSDWGAVDDPVASLAAGLDLEMPGNPLTPPRVVQAVRDGTLDEAVLDRAVRNVLQLVERQHALAALPKDDATAANHDLARRVAVESMVLLKNDGLLPLTAERSLRLGVLGRLAFQPRIQGIGSSQIQPTRLEAPWPHLHATGTRLGHQIEAWQADYDENGLTAGQRADVEAFLAARNAALIFAGQKASHDAEAWDRPSMSLAPADLQLIAAAQRSGKPFAVVLAGGGAVDVGSFDGDASALLMSWLGGQAFGSAVARVLFGEAAPSGRLSETFARAVADHPSALHFPGGPWSVHYGEGLWVGYRYFQSFGREVAYPFGHGLSYTTFEYVDARAPETLDSLDQSFDVSVHLRNAGPRPGAEVVQIYLRHLDPELARPDRELIAFEKVALEAGEERWFKLSVDPGRLAYYHDGHQRWVTEPGDYELLVGASAADLHARLPLRLQDGTLPHVRYTLYHTLGDIHQDERGRVVVDRLLVAGGRRPLSGAPPDDFRAAVHRNLPFKKLSNFSQGATTVEQLERLLELVNSDLTAEEVAARLDRIMPP